MDDSDRTRPAIDDAPGHAGVLDTLDVENDDDFVNARRNLIAPPSSSTIMTADGQVAWDFAAYDFESGATAPPTVNASLWRQARLNNIAGLFKVVDRVYQIRGFDLSNMDIIEGDSGLIVIDPLVSAETARAGLDLYYEHRPMRPVTAVIYTHSHNDHYGGIDGIVSSPVPIIAPSGFLDHVVSEVVFAGTAMGRRSQYQYGQLLPKNALQQVDSGLGKTVSLGSPGLLGPTTTIEQSFERHEIDGVEIEFQLTPGTEAPAEMNMFFPQFRALCAAENATHTMHNILTLRGAEIRDAKKWAQYLNQTIALFGARADVVFAQHHWPTWGNANVLEFLADQRDMYEYMHDQTLQLINQGYVPMEIAETLKRLPPQLARKWYNRPYYGSLSFNVRAIYQRYLGFYDANPAHLDPLEPVDAARKYVEFMGGPQAVVAKARDSYSRGEYRWVAEVVNHVIFAGSGDTPIDGEARELQASALEQLGFQCENGTWRNAYLMGAYELRRGVPGYTPVGTLVVDLAAAMPVSSIFDWIGIAVDRMLADGKLIVLNWIFTQPLPEQRYVLTLRNSALTYREHDLDREADATLRLTKYTLDAIISGQSTFANEIAEGNISVEGDGAKVIELFAIAHVSGTPMFNVVTP